MKCSSSDTCVGNDCSGNGECFYGTCLCNAGYSGLNCSDYDPCFGNDCNGMATVAMESVIASLATLDPIALTMMHALTFTVKMENVLMAIVRAMMAILD